MTTLTGYRADRDGAYIDKDSEAVLDYGFSWADWMPTDDSISTSTWTVSAISGDSDPLAIDSSSFTGSTSKTVATLSGGTDGNIYTVSNKIVTGDGRTDRRHFRVCVKARSV